MVSHPPVQATYDVPTVHRLYKQNTALNSSK